MEYECSLPLSQQPSTCSYHSISQCTRHVFIFSNKASFYGQEWSTPRPLQGGPHFVDCPRLLIQHIGSYPPYWRPFLHPQPEDAPCPGDRDPLITYKLHWQNNSCAQLDFANPHPASAVPTALEYDDS